MTNVRSIMNKLSEFDLFVDCNRPDIIALSETWLCDKIPNSLFACSQYYNVYRCDRLSRTGGGVCLFVANDRNVNIQQISLPSEFDCLEMLAVDLNDSSSALPFRVVVAYRPPDYTSDENVSFFSAFDYLANGSGRFCLVGDLNLPEFEWELFLHPDNLLYDSAANLVCDHEWINTTSH